MEYKGQSLSGRDIATVELLEEIKAYFSEDGAALNALALGGVNATSYALKSDVAQSIADLVGAAPDTLDTIQELAEALKNNKDIVDTLDAAITAKANQTALDEAVGRITTLENSATKVSFIQTLTGGTRIGSITIDGTTTNIYAPSLTGYATETWVNQQGFITGIDEDMVLDALSFKPFDSASFTKTNIKSKLGISDWALASSKPSYAFSEITSKPTTLSGYGITNAYTKTHVNSLLENYLPLSGGEVEWLDVTGALSANGGVLIPSGEKLTIGNATLEWDGTALKVTGNMYATGTVASGGKGTAGSVAGSLTGDILPASNYTYNIGAVEQYYKYIMGNVFFAGASTNNLNLVCGTSKDIKFGYSANPANGSTYFGTWGKTNGLVVSTNMSLDSGKTLTIGDVTLSASGGKLYANGVAIN